MTIVERAEALAARGNRAGALALLEQAGDAGAFATLAVWHLVGARVPRDLAKARLYLRRAVEIGHVDMALMEIALIANGSGAAATDWPAALALLKIAAQGDPIAAQQLALLDRMALDPHGRPHQTTQGRHLSSAPAVIHLPVFLTPGECAHIAGAAASSLEPSSIVDPQTGRARPDPIRTSDGTVIGPASEDLVIRAINQRIAAASGTRVEQGEPLSVLRYAPGQQYRPHLDALPNSRNQRGWTMLLYLNDAYRGGETQFTATGLTFKGKAGDGLLFRNLDAEGRPDPLARHAGLPVTAGSKWLATRWIRIGPHDPWSASPNG